MTADAVILGRGCCLACGDALARAAEATSPSRRQGRSSCSGCHAARVGAYAGAAAGRPQPGRDRWRRCGRSAAGQRPATVMDRIAKGFSDDEIAAIAAWYARAEGLSGREMTATSAAARSPDADGECRRGSRIAAPRPRARRRRPGGRDRRRLCRGDLRPRFEAARPASRGDAGRGKPDRFHRLPVQQRGDCRAARACGAAIHYDKLAGRWGRAGFLWRPTAVDPQARDGHARRRHAARL